MLIRGYQRFISPRKGFHCAYRVHTGCASCSALGFRAIRRHGVLKGLHLLSRRFERCAEARRQLQVLVRRPRLQAGFLDCGDCGGDCAPDCSPGDCACDALDALDCLDCGDWSRREDKRRDSKPSARVPTTRRVQATAKSRAPTATSETWSDTIPRSPTLKE